MGFLNQKNLRKSSVKNKNNDFMANAIEELKYFRHEFKYKFIFENNDATVHPAFKSPVQFIYKYVNNEVIDNALLLNPRITKILDEYKLPYKYNLDNVTSIIASHLIPTSRVVSKMYLNYVQKPDNKKYLALVQASLLHDIGKVFIPSEILNKNGKLSLKERSIIETHNKLSSEILKTTKLDDEVSKLAYEHHDYEGKLKRTPENQLLMISDIYSALREQRPYKKALDNITARTILYDMGAKNKFDIGFIKYLTIF